MPRCGQASRRANARPARSRPSASGVSSSIALTILPRPTLSDGNARYQKPNSQSAAGEGEDSRPIRGCGSFPRLAVGLAMPVQEVKNFNCIRVRQRALLLEILASEFVPRQQVGIAQRRTSWIEDPRSETRQGMFER